MDTQYSLIKLPISQLRPNPDNPLAPLPEDELNSLAESIRIRGVLEPLFVLRPEKDGDSYTILAGHNRYLAARRLGLNYLPCFVLDYHNMDAALDTEVYRRMMTHAEKKIVEEYRERLNSYKRDRIIQKNLIREFLEEYKQGRLTQEEALSIALLDHNAQNHLYAIKSQPSSPPPIVVEKDSSSLEEARKAYEQKLEKERRHAEELANRIREKEKIIQDREKSIRELRLQISQAKDAIQDLQDQMESLKEGTRREVLKEFEQAVREKQKLMEQINQAMSEKIRENDDLRDEISRLKRAKQDADTQIEAIRLSAQQFFNQCREVVHRLFHQDTVVLHLTNISRSLSSIIDCLNTPFPIDDPSREKILKMIQDIKNNLDTVQEGVTRQLEDDNAENTLPRRLPGDGVRRIESHRVSASG
ncbi:MAG TPA: ParB N-terminal domain-containing protein [Methanoregulaceae archaeon]|nr:ParB N-terminal domain-containing protein [Sedimentisphaerales bacterium]HPD11330.1 ParB N-terminal domain-containing protein [Methanoregulaceae archaeon]